MHKNEIKETFRKPRPDWLKAKIPSGEMYSGLKQLIDEQQLHTVCEEARCPNMGECWNSGTATFMILGAICTRSCGFCAVKTGIPIELDADEPRRVAEAVKLIHVKYAVVTSVNRDELYDGGASIFAETIRKIREASPTCKVEVLIPDFKGDEFALNIVLDAFPDVLNHNIETVPRLYQTVRPQAKYERSLELLHRAKKRGFVTKSGLMLGLGENLDEVIDVMKDLRRVDCNILTLGQYLQPTKQHLPVDRFVHPDEFKMVKEKGLEFGFKHVESGPLVRSSYHAEMQA
ncbi:MAG: lipoyl synthase [Bacteroidetes bacterium]|nr:lipoyl synthase [Bacteroidota bacterium]MBU1422966.1 lipoyl synthase [Bacteroidota bacterium]MBU2470847.1 lipoyl synthase [Bacteroidota bacterium]MBU2636174.1 lipoyl synthase [Bacteroidota bacterium]